MKKRFNIFDNQFMSFEKNIQIIDQNLAHPAFCFSAFCSIHSAGSPPRLAQGTFQGHLFYHLYFGHYVP